MVMSAPTCLPSLFFDLTKNSIQLKFIQLSATCNTEFVTELVETKKKSSQNWSYICPNYVIKTLAS